MRNKNGGFIALIGLLIAVFLISIWFYSSLEPHQENSGNLNSENDDAVTEENSSVYSSPIENIQKAENVKNLVEDKYKNLEEL